MLLFEKDIGGHIRFAGSLSPGTHQIDITAEDYSDNSIIQTFSIHIADEGQVFLTYDLNGNLLTRISDTTVTTYEWDAANRLIAIEVEGETRSEFLYDGLSRRVGITEKVWDSNTSSFILHHSSFYLWDGPPSPSNAAAPTAKPLKNASSRRAWKS